MKNVFYFLAAFVMLASCNQENMEEPLEQGKSIEKAEAAILKATGLDVFDNDFSIQNDKNELVTLKGQQVQDFMSGKMIGSETVLELTDFKLFQNPENSKEFAINATSLDGITNITARIDLVGKNFVLSGETCTCTSQCKSGCDASYFADGCRCSDCFPYNASGCTKTSTVTKPSIQP